MACCGVALVESKRKYKVKLITRDVLRAPGGGGSSASQPQAEGAVLIHLSTTRLCCYMEIAKSTEESREANRRVWSGDHQGGMARDDWDDQQQQFGTKALPGIC